MEKMEKGGVIAVMKKGNHAPQIFKGLIFVLTGTLPTLSRDDAKERIRAFGGRVSESVSRETMYVVAGEEPGSKYDKGKKLGVTILNEDSFLKMVG